MRLAAVQFDTLAEALTAAMSEEGTNYIFNRRKEAERLCREKIGLVLTGQSPKAADSGHEVSKQDKAEFIGAMNNPGGFAGLGDILARIEEARAGIQKAVAPEGTS